MNKNLLHSHYYYLSGPIDYAKDPFSWRELVRGELSKIGCRSLNPLDKPISNVDLEEQENVGARHAWKAEGNFHKLKALMEPIRAADLRLVDKSDFIVAYLDNTIQTCGTWEEIFVGNRLKRPVLIVCKQGVKALSDWIFGTLPLEHLFDDFPSLFSYVRSIDSGENTNYLGRWQIFDYGKMG